MLLCYISLQVAAVVNTDMPVTWVCHCRVMDVSQYPNGVVVKVGLTQAAVRMPQVLLSDNGISLTCTIEWIRKTQETRFVV